MLSQPCWAYRLVKGVFLCLGLICTPLFCSSASSVPSCTLLAFCISDTQGRAGVPLLQHKVGCVLCQLWNGFAGHGGLTHYIGLALVHTLSPLLLQVNAGPLEPGVFVVYFQQHRIMHRSLHWMTLICLSTLATLMLYSVLQHSLTTR